MQKIPIPCADLLHPCHIKVGQNSATNLQVNIILEPTVPSVHLLSSALAVGIVPEGVTGIGVAFP